MRPDYIVIQCGDCRPEGYQLTGKALFLLQSASQETKNRLRERLVRDRDLGSKRRPIQSEDVES